MTEPLTDLAEAIGCTLWRADIERTGTAPSIAARRTPEAFADADPDERAKWLDMAQAILPILARRDAETWNRAVEELVRAANHYAQNYLLDEYHSPELCMDDAHRKAVVDLFDAIASLKDQNNA